MRPDEEYHRKNKITVTVRVLLAVTVAVLWATGVVLAPWEQLDHASAKCLYASVLSTMGG